MSKKTVKALAGSLRKMLEKTTLDKITVRDITDDCGYNRQTFYYHFRDVYALVEWIFAEEAKQLRMDYLNSSDFRKNIVALMDKLIEDRDFVLNTFASVNRKHLEDFMQTLLRPSMEQLVDLYTENKDIKEEDKEFLVEVFTFATVGILTEWIAAGLDPEYRAKLERFMVLIEGVMGTAIGRIEGNSI